MLCQRNLKLFFFPSVPSGQRTEPWLHCFVRCAAVWRRVMWCRAVSVHPSGRAAAAAAPGLMTARYSWSASAATCTTRRHRSRRPPISAGPAGRLRSTGCASNANAHSQRSALAQRVQWERQGASTFFFRDGRHSSRPSAPIRTDRIIDASCTLDTHRSTQPPAHTHTHTTLVRTSPTHTHISIHCHRVDPRAAPCDERRTSPFPPLPLPLQLQPWRPPTPPNVERTRRERSIAQTNQWASVRAHHCAVPVRTRC